MPRNATVLILTLILTLTLHTTTHAAAPQIDPAADKLLRAATQPLADAKAMTYRTQTRLRVQQKDQPAETVETQCEVVVERPNKLRQELHGAPGRVSLLLVSDGKTLYTYIPELDQYLRKDAPPNFAVANDPARIGADTTVAGPVLHIATENPYEAILENVTRVTLKGRETIDCPNGVDAHHLVLQEEDSTWDLWISGDDRPMLLRMKMPLEMEGVKFEWTLDYYEWVLNSTIPEEVFTFTPPENAHEVKTFTPEPKEGGEKPE